MQYAGYPISKGQERPRIAGSETARESRQRYDPQATPRETPHPIIPQERGAVRRRQIDLSAGGAAFCWLFSVSVFVFGGGAGEDLFSCLRFPSAFPCWALK